MVEETLAKIAYGHAAILRDAGLGEDEVIDVLSEMYSLSEEVVVGISMLAFHFECVELGENLTGFFEVREAD